MQGEKEATVIQVCVCVCVYILSTDLQSKDILTSRLFFKDLFEG